MHTKLISSLLLSAAAALIVATPAFADEAPTKRNCQYSATIGVRGQYNLDDFGASASNGEPVANTVLVASCGKWSFDHWTSTQLTGGGTYGSRGTGDEHDLEITYSDSVESPVGKVGVSAHIAWYMLDLGMGLGNLSDDYIQSDITVNRSVSIGRHWTITPYARYIHDFATGSGNPDYNFARFGVQVDGPVTLPILGKTTLSGELAHTWGLDGATDPHSSVWHGQFDLTKSLSTHLSASAGVRFTQRHDSAPTFTLTYHW